MPKNCTRKLLGLKIIQENYFLCLKIIQENYLLCLKNYTSLFIMPKIIQDHYLLCLKIIQDNYLLCLKIISNRKTDYKFINHKDRLYI